MARSRFIWPGSASAGIVVAAALPRATARDVVRCACGSLPSAPRASSAFRAGWSRTVCGLFAAVCGAGGGGAERCGELRRRRCISTGCGGGRGDGGPARGRRAAVAVEGAQFQRASGPAVLRRSPQRGSSETRRQPCASAGDSSIFMRIDSPPAAGCTIAMLQRRREQHAGQDEIERLRFFAFALRLQRERLRTAVLGEQRARAGLGVLRRADRCARVAGAPARGSVCTSAASSGRRAMGAPIPSSESTHSEQRPAGHGASSQVRGPASARRTARLGLGRAAPARRGADVAVHVEAHVQAAALRALCPGMKK